MRTVKKQKKKNLHEVYGSKKKEKKKEKCMICGEENCTDCIGNYC